MVIGACLNWSDCHETNQLRAVKYRRFVDFARQGFGGLRTKDPTGEIATRRAPEAIARSRVGTSGVPTCPAKIFQSQSPLRNLGRSRQAAALGDCAVKGRTTSGRFQDLAAGQGASRSKLEVSVLSPVARPRLLTFSPSMSSPGS